MSQYGPGDRPPAVKVVKPKRKRRVVVRPPAGDVASSGGGSYGIPEAKKASRGRSSEPARAVRAVYKDQPVLQRNRILKNATGPTGDTVRAEHAARERAHRLADIGDALLDAKQTPRSQAERRAVALANDRRQRVASRRLRAALGQAGHMPQLEKPEHGDTGLLATALNLGLKNAIGGPIGIVGDAAIKKLTGVDPHAPVVKALRNAPADAAELAVTTPSSVAKLASTAVHDPKKVPGMLAEPYIELAKHPGKMATEHPVTTALMLQPAVRAPGRAAGSVLRLAGGQTLERPAATLPGTALRDVRTGSRDAMVRAVQAREDAKAPVMTAKEVHRRVDETFAASQRHVQRAEAAAYRQARARFKHLPKDERAQAIAEHVEGARGGALNEGMKAFGREFGATAYHDESGAFVKPKNATEGVLHDTHAQAKAVADRLNTKGLVIRPGTRLYRGDQVAHEFVVRPAGDKFMVLPKVAADRLKAQRKIGTSQARMAKVLRQSRAMFTRTVLPYRPTWLSGQAIEGVVRSAVAGAGPTSYLRGKRLVAELERQEPGSGKRLLERAAPGGLVANAPREMTAKTLHQEFPDSTVARALTDLGRAPGVKQVRQLHHAVSRTVFQRVNGQGLEGTPQMALLGRALKKSPLMEKSVIGLSDKAIAEAARGLHGTESQVALARAVERSYGKYAGFSPNLREGIMHWTPFLPWYLNTAQFLFSVLPKDHPIATALLASTDAATEDWRKSQGLSLRGGERLPAFMLGGYPKDGGKNIIRLGHYTPFGVGTDVTGAASGLPLPQFKGFYDAVSSGIDWKGHQLKHKDGRAFNQGERWLYGLTQLAESFVPLASQTEAVVKAKDRSAAARKQFRLLSSTPANRKVSKGPAGVPPPPAANGSGPQLPAIPPPPS